MADLSKYDKKSIGKLFDYAVLPKTVQEKDIRDGCREAIKYNCASFYSSSPFWTPIIKEELAGTDIHIGTGIAFPFGSAPSKVKAYETEYAVKLGCTALDMVMNIGALKGGNYEEVVQDIQAVVDVAKNQVPKKVVKVIIETGLLTHEEKIKACQLVIAAGGDFVKTCTGFNGGAALEVIEIIKQATEGKVKIKASGGIKDFKTAQAMLEAGADRLGTSSGVAIIKSIG